MDLIGQHAVPTRHSGAETSCSEAGTLLDGGLCPTNFDKQGGCICQHDIGARAQRDHLLDRPSGRDARRVLCR
jgi:hypothetical protein